MKKSSPSRTVREAQDAALELLARRVMELEARVMRLERKQVEGVPVDLPA